MPLWYHIFSVSAVTTCLASSHRHPWEKCFAAQTSFPNFSKEQQPALPSHYSVFPYLSAQNEIKDRCLEIIRTEYSWILMIINVSLIGLLYPRIYLRFNNVRKSLVSFFINDYSFFINSYHLNYSIFQESIKPSTLSLFRPSACKHRLGYFAHKENSRKI